MSVSELEPADRIIAGCVGSGVVSCGWVCLVCDGGSPAARPGFRPAPERRIEGFRFSRRSPIGVEDDRGWVGWGRQGLCMNGLDSSASLGMAFGGRG